VTARVPSLHPKKSLGQNFLRDENIARKIVAAIDPGSDEVLLEIGPGEGALTKYLAPLVRRLIVVDIDRRMIIRLHEAYPAGEVEILHEDILSVDLEGISRSSGCPLRIVGNIPYNITTPILFHVLDHRAHVADVIFMMQKEVARRIVARPNTKDYGILSVFCQLYADADMLFDVSPNAFFPKPKVSSSVVRLNILQQARYAVENEPFFRSMVRSVFGKRRKMLRNSLRYFVEGEGGELPAGFDLEERPEQLSLEELVKLGNAMFSGASRVGTGKGSNG